MANALSMTVRITFTSVVYTQALCEPKGERTLEVPLKIISFGTFDAAQTNQSITIYNTEPLYAQALVIFSIVARLSDQALRRDPTALGLLAHTGCGAIILAILLVTLYFYERDAFLYLSRHDKSD